MRKDAAKSARWPVLAALLILAAVVPTFRSQAALSAGDRCTSTDQCQVGTCLKDSPASNEGTCAPQCVDDASCPLGLVCEDTRALVLKGRGNAGVGTQKRCIESRLVSVY